MSVSLEQRAAFLVGTVPLDLPPEQRKMGNAEMLEYNMRRVYDLLGPYMRDSAPTTECTPEQIDWQVDYAKNVLPHQPGIVRYPGPASAKSLLSSPHYHLEKGLNTLPLDETNLGMRIYEFAKEAIGPFNRVTATPGLGHLKRMKIDVPETAGTAMIYFGLSTMLTGMKKALFDRDGKKMQKAFWEGMQIFEDKYGGPFTQATYNEVDKVCADPQLRDKVEVQISFPMSHALVNLLYLGNALPGKPVSDAFRDKAVGYLASSIAQLFEHIPADVPKVGHACETNLNPGHWAGSIYRPAWNHDWSGRASVDYINAILQRTHRKYWPHAVQVAMTRERPPSLDPKVRQPFRNWNKDVRLIAGIIDHRASVAHHLEAARIIEEMVGGVVDLAAPCGLGRHREEVMGPGARELGNLLLYLHKDIIVAGNA